MLVDDFDFELPVERIAQAPVTPRDSARLLHVNDNLSDHQVSALADLLRPGDLLVCNDTKVIPARLSGTRLSPDNAGARVEVTLHLREGTSCWRAFARPAKKIQPGNTIQFAEGFHAEVSGKFEGGEVVLEFNLGEPELMVALSEHGFMPLPPYIKREKSGRKEDLSDYQTLFATHDGAVAAPTAGLHFTPDLMTSLTARDIEMARLTLHVGAGTFLPVKVEDTDDHVMHSEWGEVTQQVADRINAVRAKGGRIVAVGTTSLRLLESAASIDGTIKPFQGLTDIFITPGYTFKIVDVLMTNFHLPKSTLFMLVSAFAGLKTMQDAYTHAIANDYRFYSYGDTCLLEGTQS